MKLGLIYMASGFGTRFGQNKLFYLIDDKPMYWYGIALIYELVQWSKSMKSAKIEIHPVVVSQYEEILQEARSKGYDAIQNKIADEGISASIRLGLDCCDEDCTDYLFLVADQPYLKVDSVWKLILRYQRSSKSIGCVGTSQRNGNPVIFNAKYKEELENLTDDNGGKKIVKEHTQELYQLKVNEIELQDIDTLEDAKRIQR